MGSEKRTLRKVIIVILIAILMLIFFQKVNKKNLYEDAYRMMKNQEYEDAIEIYEMLGKYKNSKLFIKKCHYELGKQCYDEKKFADALVHLWELDYEDSDEIINEIYNGKYSINKFVERYNEMADTLKENEGVVIEKIKVEDVNFELGELTTGAGGTIIFNNANEGLECKYEIKSFMWDKRGWTFTDSNILAGEWYCAIAGFSPDSTIDSVSSILAKLADQVENSMYGSVYVDEFFYNTSKINSEITLSGRIDD